MYKIGLLVLASGMVHKIAVVISFKKKRLDMGPEHP
jgi:hypothetical protein